MTEPSRGEIWLVDLNPTRGHEPTGMRPGLVVSVDLFNHGPAGLVALLPLNSVAKGIPFHIEINPSDPPWTLIPRQPFHCAPFCASFSPPHPPLHLTLLCRGDQHE